MFTVTETTSLHQNRTLSEEQQHREPLKLSGVLDNEEHFDVTPIIGREFPSSSLKEWLAAPNSDELLRDLAITGQYIVMYRRTFV